MPFHRHSSEWRFFVDMRRNSRYNQANICKAVEIMSIFDMWNLPFERISGNEKQLQDRFEKAQAEGRAQGYVPVIFMETDSDMLQSACEDALDEFDDLDAFAESVRAASDAIDPQTYECDEWARIQADRAAGLFDDMEDGETEDGFALEGAKRLFLLKVPVNEPWRVFERIPFGGFGSCPENGVHAAFARMWYEKYGAVPAIISDCSVQYLLPAAAKPDASFNDQLIQYCPSLTEYIHPDAFAGQFAPVRVWFFFWD